MKRLVLAAGLALCARVISAQDDGDATRFFALPMVRDTRELAAVAEEHLAAERYPEAIGALQRILEDHAQEVLPAGTELGLRSTHAGAAEWALARLTSLPPAARAEYGARFGPRAAAALAHARLAPTRPGLTSIPRRWPLTPAAVQAWWALGDLELESGRDEAAELAWRQAIALEHVLDPATAGVRDARRAWLEAREAQRARAPRSAPSLPRADAETWSTPLDLTPFAATRTRNLQPVVAGESVLVSSTLRLYAVDAFSGELRWQAGPPAGWNGLPARSHKELWEGINNELLLAPAVGDGVALAVMQEPFTEYDTEDWQGIEIMKAIPERRLHAFDLETGRELWNHAPELASDGLRLRWDGSGSYAQRMMVAGTPVVAGARVLVPCYRMQGRIDYHVACYELSTGELLWSTLVISGQRERNMFGRSVKEFCASPLVVTGSTVLAQSELGSLAAIELFSGRIQWQSTYDQIPLPRTRSYNPPERPVTWRLAPPVVVGDVVVFAPSDSVEVVAVRLADGAKLWSYREGDLQRLDRETELLGFNLLVGADQDTLYLSGAKLAALHKAGGIGTSAPFASRWARELDLNETAPRALLSGECLLAPNEKTRVAFDRKSGERLPALSGAWGDGAAGFACLEDGALYCLSAQGLSGTFDWQAQLERARRLASTDEEAPLRLAAELFLRHGELELQGGDASAARLTLADARAFFVRLRARSGRPDARAELECVRLLARSLTELGRTDEALAVLDEARPLAGGRREQAELLFLEERILRPAGGAARIARLDELGSVHGDLALPPEVQDDAVRRWLAAASEGRGLEPEADPIPTLLWVALERAGEHERAGELAAALTDLHLALEHARGLALARGFPLSNLLHERIAAVLRLPGGSAAYAPIEAHAAALLAAARDAGDEAALEDLSTRYPHSHAAEEALGLQIERAAAARDVPNVARLVRAALARGALPSERETDLLLVLAHTLGASGNIALERGLVSALARSSPAHLSPLPEHGGRRLDALASELVREGNDSVPALQRFDARVVSAVPPERLELEFLGALRPAAQAPESAPLELHLYATKDKLLAYSSAAPSKPAWTRPLDLARPPCAFAPGRFVFGTRSGLACLDERGRELWTRAVPEDPRELALASGVLVASLHSGKVAAFDVVLGLPLWERNFGADDDWSGPLAGDGHAVFFSQIHRQTPRALVLDLFRGRVTAEVPLVGHDARAPLLEAAWIQQERLIVPAFALRPSQLSAFELEGGARAWTLEFGRDEELHSIAHSQGEAYPVALAAALGPGNGGVYELDARTGTKRLVVPLRPGERVMGLEAQRSTELEAPYLFTYAHSEKERSIPIRALHLPYGVQWTWALPIAAQEIYDGRMLPMPAVSADCVAIAYQARRSGAGQGSEAALVFLDKRAGKKVDTLILGDAFDQANRLELRGLGEALFVLGKASTPRGACLDILEKLR